MANCTACGQAMADGDRFCGACGAPAPEPAAAVPPPTATPAPPPVMPQAVATATPWFKTAPGILGIVMVVAAAAVITVVLFTRGGDGGTTTAGGGTTTTALAGGDTSTTATTVAPTTTVTTAIETTTTAAAGTTTTAATTTTIQASGYSADFRDAFMEEYVGGGNRTFCRCAFAEFESRYTEADVATFLGGLAPVPPDFSDASLACLGELPPEAPLPAFALPNTCVLDGWATAIHYPSGWEVDEAFGECLTYRPVGDLADSTPIMITIDAEWAITDIVDLYGAPTYTFDLADRTVIAYVSDSPSGGVWVDYHLPLWPDVPGGPVISVLTADDTVPDVILYAGMMIQGLEITPYSP